MTTAIRCRSIQRNGTYCQAHGCNRKRQSNNLEPYCNAHRETYKKHGHPLQLKIRRSSLRESIRIVSEFISYQSQKPTWGKLEDTLKKNHESAREEVKRFMDRHRSGVPSERNISRAYGWLEALYKQYSLESILELYCAYQYLYIEYPKMFESDRAYKTQITRSVYEWSGHIVGYKYDKSKDKYIPKTLYIPKYIAEFVYNHLYSVFGSIGYFVTTKSKVTQNDRENLLPYLKEHFQ